MVDLIVFSPPYGKRGIGDWQSPRYDFIKQIKRELAEKGFIVWQGQNKNAQKVICVQELRGDFLFLGTKTI
jgi:hypothetical protein